MPKRPLLVFNAMLAGHRAVLLGCSALAMLPGSQQCSGASPVQVSKGNLGQQPLLRCLKQHKEALWTAPHSRGSRACSSPFTPAVDARRQGLPGSKAYFTVLQLCSPSFPMPSWSRSQGDDNSSIAGNTATLCLFPPFLGAGGCGCH